MSDDSRSRRRRGRPQRPERGRRHAEPDESWNDDEDWDEPADDAASGRGRDGRRRSGGSRSGGAAARGRGRGRGGGSFDWSALEDDEPAELDDDAYDDEDEDDRPRRPVRRSKKRPPREQRLTLMDLCTPVFGYAAILPQDPSGVQPGYAPFREEVLTAIQRVENDAPKHGIELEDARQAAYALSFFMDAQVAGSAWNAKNEWAGEPLGIVLQQDPEGGINFFKRLETFGDRQKSVKEVYLVCLALGFRGKYAELEATQQAAQIGEIRQKLVRTIHPVPLDKQPELFPEAYRPANSIEHEVPPPPRWWVVASVGTIVVAAALFLVLLWAAGGTHRRPLDRMTERLGDAATHQSLSVDRPSDDARPQETSR